MSADNRIKSIPDRRDDLEEIIASAGMGIWHIELIDGRAPRMLADTTMKTLMGIEQLNLTP